MTARSGRRGDLHREVPGATGVGEGVDLFAGGDETLAGPEAASWEDGSGDVTEPQAQRGFAEELDEDELDGDHELDAEDYDSDNDWEDEDDWCEEDDEEFDDVDSPESFEDDDVFEQLDTARPVPTMSEILAKQDDVNAQLDELNARIENLIAEFTGKKENSEIAEPAKHAA